MSVPVSPVEVCNLSLDLLRHPNRMNSIDEPETEEEALGASWYDAMRRAVLRKFPWNFARIRATLPRLAAAPAFGYPDAYQLPADYLNVVFLGEDPVNDPITDFTVENGQILIDNGGAASLPICYVYDVTEVVKFDSIFLMLLVSELAVVFGNSIAGLNKSIASMEKIRDRWEYSARVKNGQENKPKIVHRSPLLERRRQGTIPSGSDGIHLFPQ